jgi:hypothetical protein
MSFTTLRPERTTSTSAANYTGTDPIADHYVILTQSGTDTVVAIDPDGNGVGAPHTIATLENVTATTLKIGIDIFWS